MCTIGIILSTGTVPSIGRIKIMPLKRKILRLRGGSIRGLKGIRLNIGTGGLLGPAKGCSMGEKIAFQMEMDILSKCLDGGDIPKGLADDPKFVKAIEELKKSGFSISR
jgi:hypothetical protein